MHGPHLIRHAGSKLTEIIHNDTYRYIDPVEADYTNRSAFLTGATKGVGRATALSLARAGVSKIALCARSSFQDLASEMKHAAKQVGKPEPTILLLKVDVQNNESILAAADKVRQEFGTLDVVINNAGTLEDFVKVLDSNTEEWWKTWTVNLRGVYLVTKAFLPLLLSKEGDDGLKTIINVSSIGAHGLRPGASSYQTTKLAILRFTEFLCTEYAKEGLLAYAIHPGAVMTELSSRMPREVHGILTDKPQLAADTMVWLAKERRTWLAGRYIAVNWDMEQFLAMKKDIEGTDKLKVRMVI